MFHRSPSVFAGLSVALLALLSLAPPPVFSGDSSGKMPLPEGSAQAEAAKLAKDLYGDDYAAAKTPAEKRALAQKILAKAREMENDLPGCYVLLRLSRDIAIQAGDVETALLAVENIDHRFQVHALDLKREVVVKSASFARTAVEHKLLVDKCLAIFDSAVAGDDFQAVTGLSPLALDESAKSGSENLARKVQQRVAEIEGIARSYEKVRAAAAILDKAPDDPEANLTVGGYTCFVKGRWEEGVPKLALGKDPALKAVAVKELDEAKSPQAELDLANQWRDLAEVQTAAVKTAMRERAVFWYRKSSPGLTGLTRSVAEIRIKELLPKEIAPPIRTPAHGGPAEAVNPGSGDYRPWQTKGGDSPFDAQLKQVERNMVVLQKKADDQIAKIAFDDLCDRDQEVVSDWTLGESDRIWQRATAKIGPRDSREVVKAKELARALDGAAVRAVFSVQETSAAEQGKSGTKLHLSGAWESKLKEIVLPLPLEISANIPRNSKLVVQGRLSIRYAACPFCGGTGKAKCPRCLRGLVYHTENKPIVFPDGQRINQSVQVATQCPQCKGTGRFGDCRQHNLTAWEPFGTRKLPQGSFFTLTDSDGARRVCFALDEPCIEIFTAASTITLRRIAGKVDIQTSPAKTSP